VCQQGSPAVPVYETDNHLF